jgi:hypothetical protein
MLANIIPKKPDRAAEINEKLHDIIKAHGVVSNIPMNHEYWDLLKELKNINASKIR